MRRILAGLVLASAAFTVSFAGSASAGCVEEYVLTGEDSEGDPIVVQNPDGSITIYPPKVPPIKITLAEVAAWTSGFVDCVV